MNVLPGSSCGTGVLLEIAVGRVLLTSYAGGDTTGGIGGQDTAAIPAD